MKVFKFGGASVKDANAVRNVARILDEYSGESLVVVVSAMGKTTNALEKVMTEWYQGNSDSHNLTSEIVSYHNTILEILFPEKDHPVYISFNERINQLQSILLKGPSGNYDMDYDQVVSMGEILSTVIIHEYLLSKGKPSAWVDVRDIVRTDNTWREGKVDWDVTTSLIQKSLFPILEKGGLVLTQGFLGSTAEGQTTTLGREGSDYTAAILSYGLDAEEMVIWKDVPGLLNADPKYFSKTEKLASISYREAIELSYYGATIIHPKTIKPLQNKSIPLSIKSFVDTASDGTLIQEDTKSDHLIPSFIFKVDQVLLSISPRDFSFIDEQNLSDILALFADLNIHIHLMQNTALSFSVCIDNNDRKLPLLFDALRKNYKVRYNTGLELITIRHYDQPTIDRVMEDGKFILLEMRSRATAQFVVRPIP
ncbi:MAG: aspartate kinase [Bacteroidales bacterium]|nr:aspartate kinase [Bacteroidales bacterium]